MLMRSWKLTPLVTVRAVAVVSLVALALVAPGVQAKHDYEYAMALAQKLNYYDLAIAEFDRMIASGEPGLKVKGEFGKIKMLLVQARSETDNAKKLAMMDDALAKMEALMAGGAGGVTEARFDLGELYIEKAKFLLERAEKEADQAAAHKEAARGTYEKAIGIFKTAADEFGKQAEGIGEAADAAAKAKAEEIKVLYRRSTYYTIECEFERAVTWPLGDEKRNAILKGLKEKVEQFCWDNEDYIEAYYAYTILGQALCNLVDKPSPKEADLEEAFAAFGSALAIPVTKGTEWCRTLAYSRYLGECNRFGFFDRALGLAKTMRKEYPGIEEINFGQAAVIEEAVAYFGKREIGTAIAIVGNIAKLRTFWGSKAQLLLGKWQAFTGSTQSPEDAFLVAEGLRRERNFWPSIRSYQAAIAALERSPSPEADAKFLVKSWENIAFSYKRLGLAYESFHALMEASKAAQKLGDANKAGENAYYAFTAIKSRSYASKAEGDAKLADEAREYFLKNFPTSPYQPGIQLQLARDLEEGSKYAEAVAAYQKIDKQTEFYEEALSRIGICGYRKMRQLIDEAKGKIDDGARAAGREALKGLEDYLAFVKSKPASAADDEKRQELLSQVVYYQGSVYDRLEEADKVLEVLKDYETRFEKGIDPNLLGATLLLRLKANITFADKAAAGGDATEQKRRLDLAAAELELIKRTKSDQYTGLANQRLGFAYVALGEKERTANNVEAARGLDRTAIKYLVPWAIGAATAKYDQLKFVAVRCYVLGTEGDEEQIRNAIRLLEKIVEKYAADVEKDRNEPDRKKAIDLKYFLAELLFKTEQWGKALTMLRDDYARNPDSLFAIRSLGRCYYEVGRAGKMDAKRYDSMILESRQEELGLLEAFKNQGDAKKKDWLKKLVVQRASQIYSDKLELDSQGKKKFDGKDYDAFQRQWLANSPDQISGEFKKVVDLYYLAKRKELEGEADVRKITLSASMFALGRSLYYYRLVVGNTAKNGKEWWYGKYYTIAAQLEQGRAHLTADPEGGDTYKKGVAILGEATSTHKNLTMLNPKLGAPPDKPDEADPEVTAMFEKLLVDIKELLGK